MSTQTLHLERYSAAARAVVAAAQKLADERKHRLAQPLHVLRHIVGILLADPTQGEREKIVAACEGAGRWLQKCERSAEPSYLGKSLLELLSRAETAAGTGTVRLSHLVDQLVRAEGDVGQVVATTGMAPVLAAFALRADAPPSASPPAKAEAPAKAAAPQPDPARLLLRRLAHALHANDITVDREESEGRVTLRILRGSAPKGAAVVVTQRDVSSVVVRQDGTETAYVRGPDDEWVVEAGAGELWSHLLALVHVHLDPPVEKLTTVAAHPQGQLLGIGTARGTFLLWDVATRKVAHRFDAGDRVARAHWTPDGARLLVATAPGRVLVRSGDGKDALGEIETGHAHIKDMAVSNDGRFATCGDVSAVRTWTLDPLAAAGELVDGKVAATAVAFVGDLLISGYADGCFAAWGPDGKRLGWAQVVRPELSCIGVDHSGKSLVFGSSDGGMQHFHVRAPVDFEAGLSWKIPPRQIAVNAIDFAPDGRFVAAFSDNSASLFRAWSDPHGHSLGTPFYLGGKPKARWGRRFIVSGACFIPGAGIATAHFDGTLRLRRDDGFAEVVFGPDELGTCAEPADDAGLTQIREALLASEPPRTMGELFAALNSSLNRLPEGNDTGLLVSPPNEGTYESDVGSLVARYAWDTDHEAPVQDPERMREKPVLWFTVRFTRGRRMMRAALEKRFGAPRALGEYEVFERWLLGPGHGTCNACSLSFHATLPGWAAPGRPLVDAPPALTVGHLDLDFIRSPPRTIGELEAKLRCHFGPAVPPEHAQGKLVLPLAGHAESLFARYAPDAPPASTVDVLRNREVLEFVVRMTRGRASIERELQRRLGLPRDGGDFRAYGRWVVTPTEGDGFLVAHYRKELPPWVDAAPPAPPRSPPLTPARPGEAPAPATVTDELRVLLTFSDLPSATGALRDYYAWRARARGEAGPPHVEPRPWAPNAKPGDELFWLDTNVTVGARLWEERGTYLELSLRGGSLADVAHVVGKLSPVPRLLGDPTETSAAYVERPTRIVRVLVYHQGDTLVRVTAHFQHADAGPAPT